MSVPPSPGLALGEPPDQAPLTYAELHRAGLPGRWRPLLGVLLVSVGLYVVGPGLVLLPFALVLVLIGQPALVDRIIDLSDPTPLGMAYLNLALGAGMLFAWAASRWLHGLRPRWLSSVRPRLRWGYLAACLPLSVLVLVATVAVAVVVPDPAGVEPSAELNPVTDTVRNFVLVIVLLTPIQAAAEEYVFRGYLTQAFGGLFGTAAAVVVPAVIFALAHGLGQSPAVFFDRLAFGLVAGVLVVRTGGLEAPIAMHVLNNFAAYGLGLAFGDMASTLNPTGGSWWSLPVTLTQSLLYLAGALLLARWFRLSRTADPGVLAASSGRVYRFPPAPSGA